MKITELIQQLEKILENEGDIDVHWGFEGRGSEFMEDNIEVRDGLFSMEPKRLVVLGED